MPYNSDKKYNIKKSPGILFCFYTKKIQQLSGADFLYNATKTNIEKTKNPSDKFSVWFKWKKKKKFEKMTWNTPSM